MATGAVDQSHPFYVRYQGAYRNGEWWAARAYDPIFGRKLPVLFERCGLENIRHEATAEVVRWGSPWAQWWQQTLEAIRDWEKAEHGMTKARKEVYPALLTPWIDPSCIKHWREFEKQTKTVAQLRPDSCRLPLLINAR